MKMGDAISPPGGYVGRLQMQVDIGVGPAGNVWVGNTWDDWESVLGRVEEPRTTRGGTTLRPTLAHKPSQPHFCRNAWLKDITSGPTM
jgi:hypothetical protein